MRPINNKLAAALLLLSAPAFAAGGVCILCPPGHDCSTGTPVLKGTTNQVFARTAAGTAWQAYEPPALTWDNITDKPATFAPAAHTHDYVPPARTVNGKALSADITLTASELGVVPNTRTIAGLALSGNIWAGSLASALKITPGGTKSVRAGCSRDGGTKGMAGSPVIEYVPNVTYEEFLSNSSTAWYYEQSVYCWCRFESDAIPGYYSAWVFSTKSDWSCFGSKSNFESGNCMGSCATWNGWHAASTWN